PAAAIRLPMSRIDGRRPKASAQIRTPGCLPAVGWMKAASQAPSGVVTVTLLSVTGRSAPRATVVVAAATPAARDSATKSRREKSSAFESCLENCRSSFINPPRVELELLERRLGRAHAELAGRLDVELRHRAVLHDDRETLAALAHAELARVELE